MVRLKTKWKTFIKTLDENFDAAIDMLRESIALCIDQLCRSAPKSTTSHILDIILQAHSRIYDSVALLNYS